jgi:hypothetical protein
MLSRRSLLQAFAASTTGTLALRSLAAEPPTYPLTEPTLLLEAYQRLSGSFDDRLIIWWMSGTRYGVIDSQSTALYGMEVGMFHRWYRQPDGSFKAAFFELTYYTNLATGELLREFNNPYTGKVNRVRHVRLGPEIRALTSEGLISPDNPMVHDYRSNLGPAVTSGEQIWIPTSVEATIRFPKPEAPTILLNIYTTVQGTLADAFNKNLTSAACTLEFTNVLKWEPWMEMGDYPGHMMSIASGRKMEALDELPPDYLAMATEVHEKYIANPVNSLEKYASQLRMGSK